MPDSSPPSGHDEALRSARQQQVGRAPLSRLRHLVEYAGYYSAWLVFGVVSLLWSLPAALLRLLLPPRLGASFGQYAIMAGFRPFVAYMEAVGIVRCDLSALDALRAEGALVIAPNHPTLLDAVLIISRLPRVVCIVKAPIWDNPFLGGGARLGGYLRNDAGLQLTKRAACAVKAGVPLLIFPEGTRTLQPPIDAFKGGFALIAAQSRAPIQTVFIECSAPFLGKGWPWYRKPVFPVVYRARLGRRFEVTGDLRRFVGELEGYYRDQLGGVATGSRVEP
jgi:1-acyl-sn-glycerol-3-phosphate acyltransferase